MQKFKSLRLIALLAVVQLLPSGFSQWEHTVYVSVSGSDSDLCITSNSVDYPCETVSFAIDNVESSTQIIMLGGTHIVDSVLTISAKQDICLEGVDGAGLLCVPSNETVGAGLSFVLLSNLHITGLTITNCGVLRESSMHNVTDGRILLFKTAVCLLNCSTVTIERITINHSTGIGLTVFDTNGNVSIEGSNFSNNSVPESERETYYGGGGMYIELTYCSPGRIGPCDYRNNPYSNGSFYTITNCMFQDNQATTLKEETSAFVQQGGSHSRRLGKGGGLSLTIKGSSSQNLFTVSQCHFVNNSASFGGGFDVQIQDFATFNAIHMVGCLLLDNSAVIAGGGVRLGIIFYGCDCVYGNKLIYKHITFCRNKAKWSGGVELFATRKHMHDWTGDLINFTNCNWTENQGELASAVNLSPEAWNTLASGELPFVTFSNCTFLKNSLHNEENSSFRQSFISKAVVFSTGFDIQLNASVNFMHNNGSGIVSNGGSINVLQDSQAIFLSNHGLQGGAVSLSGFAYLKVYPNSYVSFVKNTAVDEGGAIYVVSDDTIDFLYSRSCFLQYSDNTVDPNKWKVLFCFDSNRANVKGHSIYATSLFPCSRSTSFDGSKHTNITEVFRWKSFNFSNDSRHLTIATDIGNITIGAVDVDGKIRVSPGDIYNLSLRAFDDLGQEVQPVLKATTSIKQTDVRIDPAYEYISDGHIQFRGKENTMFQLDLHTAGPKRISVSVMGILTNCTPGFVYSNSTNTCVCSATIGDETLYPGIERCSPNKGLLTKGYWAGCDEEDYLLTAECPLGYCSYENATQKPFIYLEKNCSSVNQQLCEPQKRKGLLCGECIDNNTIFYHSPRFLCGKCKFGQVGWLLYILSELVPLTVLFVVIVAFNFRLTAGSLNGFILFAQALDLYEVNSLEQLSITHTGVKQLSALYHFIFGMFNLNFFTFNDALSFCLWNRATVLDVLIFKYVTSFYGIVLLSVLLLLFKIPNCSRCLCCVREHVQRNWGVHGISAFLILSYTQCAKVSFQILTRSSLYGKAKTVGYVVYLMGEVPYMSRRHLAYAFPAIVAVVLLAVPPLVLSAYPLFWYLTDRNKVVDELHESDCKCSKCSKTPRCAKLRRWFRIQRFKPLIDSFQGCYKDKFRFFSGLFFLYRLGIAATLAFTTHTIKQFIVLQVILTIMLAMHAIFQPYERRFHNILDSLIFANLSIINGLNVFIYYWAGYSSPDDPSVKIAMWLRVLLIYLPLLYSVFLVAMKIAVLYSKHFRRCLTICSSFIPIGEDLQFVNGLEESAKFDEDHLPHRLFYQQPDYGSNHD